MGYLDIARRYINDWDETIALTMIQEALGRIKQHYPDGALPWAMEHSPVHYWRLKDVKSHITAMYQAKNMAGCRNAIAEYEQAFNRLIEAHNRQRVLSTDEVITTFDCSRVWELPPDKAAQLEAVFAKEGMRWQST